MFNAAAAIEHLNDNIRKVAAVKLKTGSKSDEILRPPRNMKVMDVLRALAPNPRPR